MAATCWQYILAAGLADASVVPAGAAAGVAVAGAVAAATASVSGLIESSIEGPMSSRSFPLSPEARAGTPAAAAADEEDSGDCGLFTAPGAAAEAVGEASEAVVVADEDEPLDDSDLEDLCDFAVMMAC